LGRSSTGMGLVIADMVRSFTRRRENETRLRGHEGNLVYGVVQAVAAAQRTWLEARLEETNVENEDDPMLGQEDLTSTITALVDAFVRRREELEEQARQRRIKRRRDSGESEEAAKKFEEDDDEDEEPKTKKAKPAGRLPDTNFEED
jgi:hypothetical protein